MSLIQAFRPSTGTVTENLVAGATASVSTVSAPLGASVVRVVSADGPFRIVLGNTPTAVASSPLFPAGGLEYFLCQAGDKVSVIRAGSTDANVNIAFMTR